MKIRYGTHLINCTYLQDGKENTWKGIIRFKVEDNKGIIYSVEGFNLDKSDNNENKRYVFGPYGLNKIEGTLSFCIFPSDMPPIEYRLKYNEEDNCFYGTWRFFISGEKESETQRFAKIELHPYFEIGEQELENNITSALDNAKWQNNISNMLDNNKPTILADDCFPEESYETAKEHFKGHSKSKTF